MYSKQECTDVHFKLTKRSNISSTLYILLIRYFQIYIPYISIENTRICIMIFLPWSHNITAHITTLYIPLNLIFIYWMQLLFANFYCPQYNNQNIVSWCDAHNSIHLIWIMLTHARIEFAKVIFLYIYFWQIFAIQNRQ